MAVETKPLFNPELVRREVHAFTLPESAESALPRLQHWADLISSGKADTFKETALFPEFITDIFGQLLGYTGPAGAGDSFTPDEVQLMWARPRRACRSEEYYIALQR